MGSKAMVMRSDDVQRESLEQSGWTITAKSWGAQLDAERLDCYALQQRRASVAGAADVRELTAADAPIVLELDGATLNDYPGGIATQHERLVAARVMPSPTRRAFGAIGEDGALVAMTWVNIHGDSAETEFTVVHPSARGNGYGTAVKAASVLALLDAGVKRFRTGGSSENAASIAMNRSLGYVFDEEWVTLNPPRHDCPRRLLEPAHGSGGRRT